jgi:hypothetical protein
VLSERAPMRWITSPVVRGLDEVGRRWRRRAVRLSLIIPVVVLGLGTEAHASASPSRRPRRLLILSVPTLTWADLDDFPAPTLTGLLDHAAIADLTTRGDRQAAHIGAAYVTIGAGTRAAGDGLTDGDAFGVRERFGNGTAGEAFRQRTGRDPGHGLVDLGIGRINEANAALLYDAQPGALGDALRQAGYTRAVIANADGEQPDTLQGAPVHYRSAVGALMGSDGRVPHGVIGRQLLRSEPTAPFGVRLSNAAVERAFVESWHDRSVVLVEASDLLRADRLSNYFFPSQKLRQRRRAIQWTDQLVARLLAHVDLARDAVLVVAPVTPSAESRSVTVAGLRAPGVAPGLLRSATTRRSGFVVISDVAPSVLDVLGIARPDSMEGRPMQVGRQGGDAPERREFLVTTTADALLRDRLVVPVTAAVVWSSVVLAAGTVLLLGRRRWIGEALRWLALALLGFLVATFVVSLAHFGVHGGIAPYYAFVFAFAIAFAAICRRIGRRAPVDSLLVALAAIVVVIVGDQLTGAHLELNSVFGYSPTVGIRFAGISNPTFAILGGAAVALAALVAWRVGGRRGPRIAVGILVVSFIALTPPLFGQDFGGTLAAAPAFLLLGWLLLGRRVTVRLAVGLLGVLVASGLVVGGLDLLRPANQRTHVGRLFEKIGSEGVSGFATVLQRKGAENTATLGAATYLLMIAVVIGAVIVLYVRPPRLLAATVTRIPTLRATAAAMIVLGVLGYGLNDSGIAVPAIMLAVVAPAVVYLVIDTTTDAAAASPAIKRAPRPAVTRPR